MKEYLKMSDYFNGAVSGENGGDCQRKQGLPAEFGEGQVHEFACLFAGLFRELGLPLRLASGKRPWSSVSIPAW